MSQYDNLEGVCYIYAEYCPGPFYWGWWLYAAPITEEPGYTGVHHHIEWPDRKKGVWLHFDWRLDALMKGIGLPELHDYRFGAHEKYTHNFLEKWPLGVLVQAHDDGRIFNTVETDVLWDYSRMIREQQLLDWKEVGEHIRDKQADV